MNEPLAQSGPDAPSDHALVQRVAQRDRAALAELVRRHQGRVLALATRFLGHVDAAEDVCQDVFLKVWESASSYRPEARFSTWLYRVVANHCWDRRRRAKREPRGLPEPADADVAVEMEPASAFDERAGRVQRAVAELPDRQRMALVLHRFSGLSHRDIADVTGWSQSAVESCLVRAYEHLRHSLADLAPDSRDG